MSVEQILNNKIKEPYSIKSLQLLRNDKDKLKNKKKKKQKEECRFNVPVYDFSKSNSLIVFS